MAGTEITLTAEALDRMNRVTRTRERVRIAGRIDEVCAQWSAPEYSPLVIALYGLSEELRTEGLPVKVQTTEQVAQANALEIARVDAEVAAANAGDDLPEVRHLDDEEMAVGLVRNRIARGITQALAPMKD